MDDIDMVRRVVVTGTGVITPVGNDVKTYWKNLLDGVCGIDYITSIPVDDLPVKSRISILQIMELNHLLQGNRTGLPYLQLLLPGRL